MNIGEPCPSHSYQHWHWRFILRRRLMLGPQRSTVTDLRFRRDPFVGVSNGCSWPRNFQRMLLCAILTVVQMLCYTGIGSYSIQMDQNLPKPPKPEYFSGAKLTQGWRARSPHGKAPKVLDPAKYGGKSHRSGSLSSDLTDAWLWSLRFVHILSLTAKLHCNVGTVVLQDKKEKIRALLVRHSMAGHSSFHTWWTLASEVWCFPLRGKVFWFKDFPVLSIQPRHTSGLANLRPASWSVSRTPYDVTDLYHNRGQQPQTLDPVSDLLRISFSCQTRDFYIFL